MANMVPSWVACDGTFHPSEREAVRYECLLQLKKSFPEMKASMGSINRSFEEWVRALAPFVRFLDPNPPDGETTLEPETTLETAAPRSFANEMFRRFGESHKHKTPAGVDHNPSDPDQAYTSRYCDCTGEHGNHEPNCSSIDREPRVDTKGCRDGWHNKPYEGPSRCPSCGMKV